MDLDIYSVTLNQSAIRKTMKIHVFRTGQESFFFPRVILFLIFVLNIPVVKDEPHSFSGAGVGHTEVYQQYQAWVWSVE